MYEKRKVYPLNGEKRRIKVKAELMPDFRSEWRGLIKDVPIDMVGTWEEM